ncbi:hypothetical protein Taro_036891, partial [Colocasia esculenta]|nr:hypothetical protein [Colocasia esculenta]
MKSVQDIQLLEHEWAAALGQGITDKDKLQARTPRVVRWSTPPSGRLKLNVDGAFRPASGEAGGGGIIRDQNGTLCCAFAQTHHGLSSSLAAEALALRDGIAMCCRTGISDVMIETDSQNLLQIVTVQQTHQWDIACILQDIALKTQNMQATITYTPREANK